MMRMVSDTLSPLEAEEEAASEKPMTGGEDLAVAFVGVFGGILLNVVCQSEQLVEFLNREVKWVHQVSHFFISSFLRCYFRHSDRTE